MNIIYNIFLTKHNDSEIFEKSIFPKTFDKAAQDSYMESMTHYTEEMKSFTRLFEDKAFYNSVMQVIARRPIRT